MGWPVGSQAVGGWLRLPLAGGHGVEDEASWSCLPCRACHRWQHRKQSLLRWGASCKYLAASSDPSGRPLSALSMARIIPALNSCWTARPGFESLGSFSGGAELVALERLSWRTSVDNIWVAATASDAADRVSANWLSRLMNAWVDYSGAKVERTTVTEEAPFCDGGSSLLGVGGWELCDDLDVDLVVSLGILRAAR